MMTKSAMLLVDDEQMVVDSLRLQLRRTSGDGLVVECANSASEAWEVIDELRYDGVDVLLIVSDWLMPVTRGDAFLEEVRSKFPTIKRVLLTGQADDDALQRVRARGLVDLLLFKPWSDRDIAEVMLLVDHGG